MFDLFVVSRTAQRHVQGQFEPEARVDSVVKAHRPRNHERQQRTRRATLRPALRLLGRGASA